MPIDLPMVWVVVLNVTGWPVIQFFFAWAFTRMPVRWFNPPGSAAWEKGGRVYERWFLIKRWKDRLPDGARWLPGGFPKGTLAQSHESYFQQFVRETWRGELCHWATLACTPVFFLWNPLWADLVMVAYATSSNLPCILAQRYNRARLNRLLERPARRQRIT